ncbi:MAG: SDR family NAD(P)-dependent oxidoreductase [Cyanobacteria bacterium J06641_5]
MSAIASENSTSQYVLVLGASGGIGMAFVRQFLADANTIRVYATYRSRAGAGSLFDLAAAHGDRLRLLPLDLTVESEIEATLATVRQDCGRLHNVVNCVGFLHDKHQQPEKSLRHINAENLARYFQINSISAILLAKHLQPLLRHDERSVFANLSAKIGSIGDNALGGWYGYRASKAALNMLMRNVAIEYRRVCPNAIVVMLHPGTTDTRLSEPFQRNVPPEKLFTPERTVTQLLSIVNKLTPVESGSFFSWDGQRLPW